MKVKIQKELKQGSYIVTVTVFDLTEEDQKRMEKFGFPSISVAPKWVSYRGRTVTEVPINDMSYIFVFPNEGEANTFADSMRRRIENAITDLKSKRDTFTNDETIDL